MPIPALIIMAVMGLSYVIFAFVEPPSVIRGLYRVPSIFVFLPDKWILPAGRLFVGLLLLGGLVAWVLRAGIG
jgi:hypothetical protein